MENALISENQKADPIRNDTLSLNHWVCVCESSNEILDLEIFNFGKLGLNLIPVS